MRSWFQIVALVAIAATVSLATPSVICRHHFDLYSSESLHLGVRFETSDKHVRRDFTKALDFWAKLLDMEWHLEQSDNCTLALVDSSYGFTRDVLAHSGDDGIIRYANYFHLSTRDRRWLFAHEIGHALGLLHNSDELSIMFWSEGDQPQQWLDAADIRRIASLHRFRNILVAP